MEEAKSAAGGGFGVYDEWGPSAVARREEELFSRPASACDLDQAASLFQQALDAGRAVPAR